MILKIISIFQMIFLITTNNDKIQKSDQNKYILNLII